MDSNIQQLINPQNIGGYPFYGSDFVNLQERLKDLGSSYYDFLVNLSGNYSQLDAQGQVSQEVKAGVFLTYPTLTLPGGDPANADQTVVSSFIYYVDGELIYYPGGVLDLSFNTANGFGNVIAFSKDAGIKTNRVFKDGVGREATVTYSPVVTEGVIFNGGGQSYNFPAGFDLTKQYVFIGITGGTSRTLRNYVKRDLSYCLELDVLQDSINNLENANTIGDWVEVTNEAGVSGRAFYRTEGSASAGNRIIRFKGSLTFTENVNSVTLFKLSFSVDPTETKNYVNGFTSGKGVWRLNFETNGDVKALSGFDATTEQNLGVMYLDGVTYTL